MRPLPHGLALAAAAVLALPAIALGQAVAPEPTGPDFKALLLADAKVTPAIKRALRDGTAFPQPVAFGDLTADGTSDAVVLATTPGAAGAVAAYVFSTLGDKDGALRIVYRSQTLYRAAVRIAGGALLITTPDYVRGDDVCCSEGRLQRTYVYDRRGRLFTRTDSRRF